MPQGGILAAFLFLDQWRPLPRRRDTRQAANLRQFCERAHWHRCSIITGGDEFPRRCQFMSSRTLSPILDTLYRCSVLHRGDSCTDAELLERFARTHDQPAFAALLHRHGPMVLAVCRRLLPDRHEAEDAFQATFLVLVRKSGGLRQPQQLGSWLHGVAHRIALRLRQRAARWQPLPEELDLAEARDSQPLDQIAWQEIRTILDSEIERLPSKYRQPMVLCYLQGQSYSEAARSLGCPPGTVSVRLARARQKLRDRFARRGLTLSASLVGSLLGQEALALPVPAGLFTATLKAGVSVAVAGIVLDGVVSHQAIALAKGVVRTMWMAKCKSTLLMVVAAGLVCTGVGGLARRDGSQAQAQAPQGDMVRTHPHSPHPDWDSAKSCMACHQSTFVKDPELHPEQDQSKDPVEVERQMKALQEQVEEKRQQLARLRQGSALDDIQAALQKLKQANAGEPQRREAVEQFEKAFGKLKQTLGAKAPAEAMLLHEYLNALSSAPGTANLIEIPRGVASNGRVLQVDPEKKQVLLSTGAKDGIKLGQLYCCYQANKASPDQTAWIRIVQVESKWSMGKILQDYGPRAPLRPNDIIQLHDGKEPDGLREEPGRSRR
jgi:RNA polymerase sigma factor (sigma-70 family)